jgi:hypothetical protein
MKDHEIDLHKGFGKITFDLKKEDVVILLGKADEENVIDEKGLIYADVWTYFKNDLTLFFEYDPEPHLANIEISDPNAILFDNQIIGKSDSEIIDLMSLNNYKTYDSDSEPWGEKSISFGNGLIDFYFENQKLISVCLSRPGLF